MIKAMCLYSSLAEIPGNIDLSPYRKSVRPLDYDFCLNRGAEYLVLSIIEMDKAPWLYVVPNSEGSELDLAPAALFSFSNNIIPAGTIIENDGSLSPCLDILPESLACIDNWFEKYIAGDELVIKIVESEVHRLRGF